ncbi:MoaD/ThiS family protein [Listeria fleischmannii]|uniref:MoaD/ThiS family protein n=1 Tax=Listeria fleischmannii TaxID=1069827 RepID=UPI000254F479|nr:MoaD/ThiS family protein [Listeria fleischmannii]EIA19586.1 molybdopterin converting factor, subunit 1 [Listeria fleischmannii subsp. coloradonensis]STY35408.1 molybdopterin converting factor, subunit 1 [Listeria fleischmannii subsp. coloradonensis]
MTTIKFFAYLTEKVSPEGKVNASHCRTVGDLRDRISSEFPEIASDLYRCMIAINMEFKQDTDELPETIDGIAVIPPVSGG